MDTDRLLETLRRVEALPSNEDGTLSKEQCQLMLQLAADDIQHQTLPLPKLVKTATRK